MVNLPVLISIAAFTLLPMVSHAGASSVVIAGVNNAFAPSVRLQVPADFVAIPIQIQNDSKDPAKRADEIEKALRSLTDRLQQHPDLAVKQGIVSLSPREHSTLKAFSSYESHTGSSAQLYVLGAMKQDTSVFAVAKRLYQAINGIPLGDGTKVTLGNTTLGLNDPEKYRDQILKAIANSISETKKAMGMSGGVEVEGLENAVSVMQLDERDVSVFINYSLRIQTKAP